MIRAMVFSIRSARRVKERSMFRCIDYDLCEREFLMCE